MEVKVKRRSFLKALGIIGGTAAVVPAFIAPTKQALTNVWVDEEHGIGKTYEDYTAEDVIFTACQQCNSACTIKVYVKAAANNEKYTSLIRKIAGNVYSPLNMVPYGHISYDTPIEEAVKGAEDMKSTGRGFRGGRTCLKGQAGIQTAYDAYRVQKPLRRVGNRGDGLWETITWEEAYKEILEGSSKLGTPGLKNIWAYVPEAQVKADQEKVQAGEMTKQAFHDKYKDLLIDTELPDLGPKSNQIAVLAGHRRGFIERVTGNSLGSINFFDHGGYCGITGVVGNARSHDNSIKQKQRMTPDYEKADYVIVWGTNPVVANRGPTTVAPQITNAIARGLKMVVIDPRFSKTAEKAHKWVPVKPGGDGALALAMCKWIVENNAFDLKYLTSPNETAAKAINEPTWSDATFLINMSEKNRPFVTPQMLGLAEEGTFVVLENGVPKVSDLAAIGDLEVDQTINGIQVKSVFTLLKEHLASYSYEELSEMSDVDVTTIHQLASEFTSYGKRAAIHSYRGPAMHTNGYYSIRAINLLNHLIGNHDWVGGDTHLGAKFKANEGRYDLTKVPNANKAWGIAVTRQRIAYEKSMLFKRDGYPAKRPWYPLGNKLIQDVIPSSAEGYPYKLRAMIINRTSPITSGPRSNMQLELLKDTNTCELVVSSDIVIGETSQFADYILPDLSYLETWTEEDIFPIIKYKFASVIQPVTRIVNDARPTEQVYIDLLKAMGLPGVGENAVEGGHAIHDAEDYYIMRAANIAYDGTPVPDADAHELDLFEKARQKALGSYFDLAKLKKSVTEAEWKKVVYVLNRGGRYEGLGNEHNGEHQKYKFAGRVHFYDERAANFKSSYTGKMFEGLPIPEPIKKYSGENLEVSRPFQFINWKSRNMATHRTESNVWLREVRPENYLWINETDAQKLNIKSGDKVEITSSSATVAGTAFITPGIKPGVVGANFSFGHYGYGVSATTIDNKKVNELNAYGHTAYELNKPNHEESGYAPVRGGGFLVNALCEKDDSYFEGFLADRLIGGAAQQDIYVSIKKI